MTRVDCHVVPELLDHPSPRSVGYRQAVADPAADNSVAAVVGADAAGGVVAVAVGVVEAADYNRVADNCPDSVGDSLAAAVVGAVGGVVAAAWVDPAADNYYRVGDSCWNFGEGNSGYFVGSLDFADGDYANPAVQPEVDST